MNSKRYNSRQSSERIKVLLVDDSPLELAILKRILESSPDIDVAGTAANGKEAMDLIPRVEPTVICTDLHMPIMDGLQLTKEIMAKYPRPILVDSVSVEPDSRNVFELLEAGAVDVCAKPRGGLDTRSQEFTGELVRKIKIVAGVRVIRKMSSTKPGARPESPRASQLSVAWGSLVQLVVIGASTGGPLTLQAILTKLSADFPVPVVCIQHIAEGFLKGLVDWLRAQCGMQVTIAESGEMPRAGRIYFAPEGTHLRLDQRHGFSTFTDAPVNGHRPSITVAMQSAAEAYGSATAGILLTGMGDDGAQGMRALAEAGGVTIAQDEASCVVFGMPEKAIALDAARYVMSPDAIADALNRIPDIRRRPQAELPCSAQNRTCPP